MKIRKILACVIAAIILLANVTNVYAAEEVLTSTTGTVYSKYTTSASIKWNQSTVCLAAYTSSAAPSAGYSTSILGNFTYFGIAVGDQLSSSGTTSAKIYGTGNGFLAVASTHVVSYANDTWKVNLGK